MLCNSGIELNLMKASPSGNRFYFFNFMWKHSTIRQNKIIAGVLQKYFFWFFEKYMCWTKMAFILCVPDSFLRHLWTDFDETFGVYRVDPELVQRQIFDFRFRLQTGSWPVFWKPEVPIIETGSRKVSHRIARGFLLWESYLRFFISQSW